jgi:hypothetical protein
MNDGLDPADEDSLTDTVSDEALEAAAGPDRHGGLYSGWTYGGPCTKFAGC